MFIKLKKIVGSLIIKLQSSNNEIKCNTTKYIYKVMDTYFRNKIIISAKNILTV